MAQKYMKGCSIWLSIKERQIKNLMRYYSTPVRMATREKTKSSINQDVEKQELPYIAPRNAKWCKHFGKQLGSFLFLCVCFFLILLRYNLHSTLRKFFDLICIEKWLP